MDKVEMQREAYSVNELAKMYGNSPWWWRRKAYSGEVESWKFGSRLLIPASEVERIISAGRRPVKKPC